MDGRGESSVGCGYGLTARTAVVKAFAESWERLWLELRPDLKGHSAPTSSNGFAAGRSDAEAIEKSRSELIERAVLLAAWESQRGWNKWRLNASNRALLCLAADSWEAHFYVLNAGGLGLVLAAFAIHPELGAVFDAKHVGSHVSIRDERGLVLSMLRLCATARPASVGFRLPDKGAPEDHRNFYANPQNARAFDFILRPKAARSPNDEFLKIPDGEAIDTTILHPSSSLPAVAYSSNDNWPALVWGRQSIRGVNEWPHPLA